MPRNQNTPADQSQKDRQEEKNSKSKHEGTWTRGVASLRQRAARRTKKEKRGKKDKSKIATGEGKGVRR